MRLLVCAGGTGGGVYPALAVLQALQTQFNAANPAAKRAGEDLSLLWVGGAGGMETGLVARAGIAFEGIPAAGLHGVGWRRLPGNLLQLWRGYRQAQAIVRRFQPQALFFTGGYVAGPMALAARHIPTLLYVPDIEPGLALKGLARFADRIAVTAEDSRAYFSNHTGVVSTGYPVRLDLQTWERPAARLALNLSGDLPVLLVFGGSKGARSLNRALLAALPGLLAAAQVVHISGELDWAEVQAARTNLAAAPATAALAERYHAYPYLHEEMGAALAAADLVVCRAGASTLGELPQFGLPSILVPYPHAWRYQRVNASYLERQGAALVLPDQDLSTRLASLVLDLLRQPDRLAEMRQAAHSLARPNAAAEIAQLLIDLAPAQEIERNLL